MAWLNATPKPPKGSKRAKHEDPDKRISRAERLKRNKIPALMPPNPAPHLIGWLVEIGLSQAAGMGVSPISWGEINEWSRGTGVPLAGWERRLLHRLSTEYLAEGRRAETEACPPPWHAPVTRREIETETDRLRMVLG